jgi:D-alanyl-D-alanine carboxypeptidase/D-alanyl-D-alanine-endopeptidase (penicillin-binding protein 4)
VGLPGKLPFASGGGFSYSKDAAIIEATMKQKLLGVTGHGFLSLLASLATMMVVTCGRAAVPAAEGESTLASLRQKIDEHLDEPRFAAAMWGIKVESLGSGKVLYERNPGKLFSPASNSKLYTVALGFEQLGADYEIRTSLYAKRKPGRGGVLKSDLLIYGRGDPGINARLYGNDIYAALQPLVAAVKNSGIKRISGDLVGDESYFRGSPYGSGWSWDDMENYYGAEISALTLNDNCLQIIAQPGNRAGAPCRLSIFPSNSYLICSNFTVTGASGNRRGIRLYRPLEQNVVYVRGQVGLSQASVLEDVTVHNPAEFFVTMFREALRREGIKVSGKIRSIQWQDREKHPFEEKDWMEIGSMTSQPMSGIAREILKPSQNLYTDLLLAHIGEQTREPGDRPEITSEELGIRALDRFLPQAGIKKGDVLFEEGSGLSRNNLTTPNATVTLLRYMNERASGAAYKAALPIAGVDGTMRNRLKGTSAEGNVRAKTGTLRWANSLSGYLTTAAGEHLIFSIMLNRYHNTEPTHSARSDIDEVVLRLTNFQGKSTE